MRWVAVWVTLDAICPAFLLGEEAFLRLHAAVAGLASVTSFEVKKRNYLYLSKKSTHLTTYIHYF
jgi:hypothetical protein